MSEQTQQEPPVEEGTTQEEEKRDLSWHLDRIWDEIKQISRQVEQETRRGGRIARLRFDMRGLRREQAEQTSLLGQLIYDAQMASDKRPTLSRLQGYDELIGKIAGLASQIDAKESEIEELKAAAQDESEQEAKETASA